MHRLKHIFLLLLIAGLTSCNLFKKVSNSHNSEKIKSKTDSVYSSTTRDLSKTTIIEKIDTVASTKPVHIITEKPAIIDSTGIVTAILDSLMVKVKVSYNALTKSVSFDVLKRGEDVPVQLTRTTTTENDIKTSSKGRVKVTEKTKTDTKQKTSKPDYMAIITLIGSVGLVIFAIWLFLKYKANQTKLL